MLARLWAAAGGASADLFTVVTDIEPSLIKSSIQNEMQRAFVLFSFTLLGRGVALDAVL